MAKLIERVIARLSTAEPDAALYALTRAQSLDVCGSCPTGQSFDVQGRRTPAAILSGSRRTSKLSSGRDQRTDPAAWSNLRVTRSDTSSSLAGSVDSSSITKKHEAVRQSERHPRQRRNAEYVRPGRARVHISRLGFIAYLEAIASTSIALANAGSFNVFGQPPPVTAAGPLRRFGSRS